MTDIEPQVTSDIVEAEGFDLPAPAEPEPPSLPLNRDVLIRVPARHNTRLQRILDRINQDDELYMLWRCANINAVDRLGMSDPGPVHVHIVANIAHRSDGHPLTLEAGVVRVADALDMAKGRSRIAFEAGKVNIHSLSAAAIDRIEIQTGELKPVRIAVSMLSSAGVFQLDALLKEKLQGSGLEPHVEVIATIQGETEKKLVEVFRV